jgi:hypothetical protein
MSFINRKSWQILLDRASLQMPYKGVMGEWHLILIKGSKSLSRNQGSSVFQALNIHKSVLKLIECGTEIKSKIMKKF